MAPKKTKVDARKTVQIPTEWNQCLLRLAANRQQQKVWTLLGLIGKACDEDRIDHPRLPWEEMIQ